MLTCRLPVNGSNASMRLVKSYWNPLVVVAWLVEQLTPTSEDKGSHQHIRNLYTELRVQ